METWNDVIEREEAFEKLEKRAITSCGWRGHSMELLNASTLVNGRHQRTYLCTNDDCVGYVQTMINPPPNGIDIGGTAVAEHCPVGIDRHWDVTKRVDLNDYDLPAHCGICSGELVYLGLLGNNATSRCRDCGMEFNNLIEQGDNNA